MDSARPDPPLARWRRLAEALTRRSARLHGLLGLAALALLLVLMLQLVGDNRRAVRDRMVTGRLYGRSLEVLLAAERVRVEVNGAMRAERGYLLAHEESFLAPLVEARRELPRRLRELDGKLSDDPEQHVRSHRLEAVSGDYLRFLDSEVTLERQGRHDEAVERLRDGGGYRGQAEAARLIDAIVARENALLARQRRRLDASEKVTERSLQRSFWMGLFLFALAFGEGAAVVVAQRRVRRANEQLHVAATTDALTGLPNRRAFFDGLATRIAREHVPCALAIVDIDHFKSVNDRFGHPAGDEVLRVVAAALAGSMRPSDLVARIGGEEFAILLDELDPAGAEGLCDQLRQRVSRVPVRLDAGVSLLVTLSIGVALRQPGEDGEALMARADQALYRAKQEGRDRVRLAA